MPAYTSARRDLIGVNTIVKNALDEIGYGSSTGGTPTPVGSRRTVR